MTVALFVSAWIEILGVGVILLALGVALFVSAWIEMEKSSGSTRFLGSRTLRECVD